MTGFDPAAIFNGHRDRYFNILEPLFLPDGPVNDDIIRYFASLLRVLGMEDKGWDPDAESRNILHDINGLMNVKLSKKEVSRCRKDNVATGTATLQPYRGDGRSV